MENWFKIGKDISDNDYVEISTIDKNTENLYYLVKFTSDSYTLQSSHKIGIGVINDCGLLCDAVYLNKILISSNGMHLMKNPKEKQFSGWILLF